MAVLLLCRCTSRSTMWLPPMRMQHRTLASCSHWHSLLGQGWLGIGSWFVAALGISVYGQGLVVYAAAAGTQDVGVEPRDCNGQVVAVNLKQGHIPTAAKQHG